MFHLCQLGAVFSCCEQSLTSITYNGLIFHIEWDIWKVAVGSFVTVAQGCQNCSHCNSPGFSLIAPQMTVGTQAFMSVIKTAGSRQPSRWLEVPPKDFCLYLTGRPYLQGRLWNILFLGKLTVGHNNIGSC